MPASAALANSKGFGKKGTSSSRQQYVKPAEVDEQQVWDELLAAWQPPPGALQGPQQAAGTLTAPQPHVGPVELRLLDGCGRGLVAQRDILPGEVLLVANPLVLAPGPPGVTPSPAQLLPLLMQGLGRQPSTPASTPHDAAGVPPWQQAFWSLYGGPQEPAVLGSVAACMPQPVPDLQQLLQLLAHVPALPSQSPQGLGAIDTLAADTAPSTAEAMRLDDQQQPQQAHQPQQLPAAQQQQQARRSWSKAERRSLQQAAARRAQLNAFGEAYQDVVVGTLQRQRFRSFIGIWPAMAMVNHSCSPNACVVLAACGSRLVVRAAVAIPAGEQVTLSYAGAHAGSPVAVRRQVLREAFGFLCQCERCLVEQDYEAERAGQAAQDLHKVLEGQVRPRLLHALEVADTPAVQRLHSKLMQHAGAYMAALQGVEDEEDRAVLQCATLPLCWELTSLCLAHALAQPGCADPQEVAAQAHATRLQRVQLLQHIAPGSYALAQLTAATVIEAAKVGQATSGPGARVDLDELLQQCVAAHVARYGHMDVATLKAAVCAHQQNGLADDMAEAVVDAAAST